jgi:hypothetical protein
LQKFLEVFDEVKDIEQLQKYEFHCLNVLFHNSKILQWLRHKFSLVELLFLRIVTVVENLAVFETQIFTESSEVYLFACGSKSTPLDISIA